MSTTYDEEPLDESLGADDGSERSLTVMEADGAPAEAEEWKGPRCEKCSAPMKSDMVAICRNCGWYASLGRCVEVDPNWEVAEADADGNGNAGEAAQPQLSHLGVWLNLLPRWAWVIIGSMAAVVVESVIVRLVTPAEIGGMRTTWSLVQLMVGVLVFACCHVFNFLVLIADDAQVGVLDVVLRPIKLWLRMAHQLPTRLWLANSAACGLTAAVMSVVVIGALPYDRLWDWGFQQPVKQNLMGAVMDRAKKLEERGSDNLEDAIGDLAGKAGVEEEMPKAKPAKPRLKADCVILGYQLDREGRLEMLVLATPHNKKLVFAGRVNPQITDVQRAELLAKLSRIRVREPFIPLQSDSAMWVAAKYACRVSYSEKMKGGQLRDPQWDAMLGEIRKS